MTDTPLHILVKRIYDALAVENCARVMGVSEKTAYPYAQPPAEHGQTIPTERLLSLLVFARDSADGDASAAAGHIAQQFCAAAGVKAIGREVLAYINVGMDALNNGGRLKASSMLCPACGHGLKQRGFIDSLPVWSCTNCHGTGVVVNGRTAGNREQS